MERALRVPIVHPPEPRAPDLVAASALVADASSVARSLAAELAAIAPDLHHCVTFFGGPASLEMTAAAAAVGGSAIETTGLPEAYARSPVQWNRWSVPRAQRDRFVAVSVRTTTVLSTFWGGRSVVDWHYRRRLVCYGSRALALVGSTTFDGRAVDESVWEALGAHVDARATLVRMAGVSASARDDEGGSEDDPSEAAVAYLSAEGAVLAAPDDEDVVRATEVAAAAIRSRRLGPALRVKGKCFRLRAAAGVRAAEVFELVPVAAAPAAALTARDAQLVDWVRRGLPNREVAAMLGVPATTVKKALERLFARHGASNRVELLRLLDDA